MGGDVNPFSRPETPLAARPGLSKLGQARPTFGLFRPTALAAGRLTWAFSSNIRSFTAWPECCCSGGAYLHALRFVGGCPHGRVRRHFRRSFADRLLGRPNGDGTVSGWGELAPQHPHHAWG